jgi:hypothetical protein
MGRPLECYNWIAPIERRNNKPIGAMNHPEGPQSLRRNAWFKFGYEFLGVKAKTTPSLVE